uniref:ARAD1D25740p n=1 Tax=Blastobotrys adeninivorans TaxID=409370 RepID=A0A060TAR0_BLAAD
MADDKENVMDMLDSLDTLSKKKERKSTDSKREKKPKKKTEEDDIMGFLDSLAKSGASSRRGTPGPEQGEKSGEQAAAPETAADKIDDKPADKNEKADNKDKAAAAAAAEVDSSDKAAPGQAGDAFSSITSWWSKNKDGLLGSASSAVKQAEAKVRELQQGEAPQNAIESLQGSISKLGINSSFFKSTLTSVLDTIAPPISRHEQLRIHIFHDMVGYPAIDTIVYNVFDRVMQQVEGGGELTMVVQKGRERHRRGSDREQVRNLNIFRGSFDQACKLAAANIEECIRNPDQQANDTEKQKGKEKVSDDAEQEESSEEDKVRTSNIYLAIQPTELDTPANETEKTAGTIIPNNGTFAFVVHLSDPDHGIQFSTLSQAYPRQWARWLDGEKEEHLEKFSVDPRDWVIDWVEEGLGLSVGVVAQSYVARRMGVDSDESA